MQGYVGAEAGVQHEASLRGSTACNEVLAAPAQLLFASDMEILADVS